MIAGRDIDLEKLAEYEVVSLEEPITVSFAHLILTIPFSKANRKGPLESNVEDCLRKVDGSVALIEAKYRFNMLHILPFFLRTGLFSITFDSVLVDVEKKHCEFR
jgi:hypothetical protein